MKYTSQQFKQHGDLILEWEENKTQMQYLYNGCWIDVLGEPLFDPRIHRIKPTTYIPFTFEDRELFRGKWIKYKLHKIESMPTVILPFGVMLGKHQFSYTHLLEEATFLDGTPFGKLED